jgi:hypothetical protein
MWRERGARICLMIASQLIEMKVRLREFGHPTSQLIGNFVCTGLYRRYEIIRRPLRPTIQQYVVVVVARSSISDSEGVLAKR